MAKPKPAKTHCGNTWSRARYFAFIRSALRRAFMRYPVNYQLRKAQRRPYKGKNKLQKYETQCAKCKKWFPQKNTQVDHITDCGTLKSYEDLPRFVSTLFCEQDNLRILCKPCHLKHTASQRKEKHETR